MPLRVFRTMPLDVGELSRAIEQPWSLLWPKVRRLEERKDVGRALSDFEQRTPLDGLKNRRTPHLGTLVPVLMLTGMRVGEALFLAWGQVDLMGQTITVGRAKTSGGTGRGIPINDDLASILAAHRAWFVDRFGEPRRDHHLFPWGKPVPTDPSRHATDITWGWDQLRKDTKVSCRLHDLRHTFATRLAENGVSESTMLALMGHMSRAMASITLRPDIAEKRQNSEVVPVEVPVPATLATLQ
jgi:integrase